MPTPLELVIVGLLGIGLAQLATLNAQQYKGSRRMTKQYDALKAQIDAIKALVAKVAVDIQTLTDRLGNGDITRDEVAAVANELGGIAEQLSNLDAKTDDPPANPPATTPDNPPADGQ